MKILVVADIHGDYHMVDKILEEARGEGPDVVVCPGNFTDMFKNPSEFSQLDLADLILQKLASLGKPLLCVPGNHDPYEILDVLDDYQANLHGKHKKAAGVNFIGFGGAQTPFHTLFEPGEDEVKAALSKLPSTPPLILVVHNPPKNTAMDKLKSGEHVGSEAVRGFILGKKPLLTIAAHIHEAAGQDVLGKTTLFNHGPAFTGRYGVVEIKDNAVICKIHKINLQH